LRCARPGAILTESFNQGEYQMKRTWWMGLAGAVALVATVVGCE
jgi:hypothetical protein